MTDNKREADPTISERVPKKQSSHRGRIIEMDMYASSCLFRSALTKEERSTILTEGVEATTQAHKGNSSPKFPVAIDTIIQVCPQEPSPPPQEQVRVNEIDVYNILMDDHFSTIHPHPTGQENEFISLVFVYQSDNAAVDEEGYKKRLFYVPRELMDYIIRKGKVIDFNGISLPEDDTVWKYFTAETEKTRTEALAALSFRKQALVAKVLRLFPETGVLLRPFLRIEVDCL